MSTTLSVILTFHHFGLLGAVDDPGSTVELNTLNETNPDEAGRRLLTKRNGSIGAGSMLIVGGATALLTALAGQAGATATVTVDSAADGAVNSAHCTDLVADNCTLRDAAAAADDGDTIVIDASVSMITLTNGRIELPAVHLTGPGSTALTISTTAVAGAYDLFHVSGTGDVVLSGFTLNRNPISAQNTGDLTLGDVTVSGSERGYGGALYTSNVGNLEIRDSSFIGNQSPGAGGGAVYAFNAGSVTISDSTFTENSTPGGDRGGAINLTLSVTDATITGSTFTGNSSTYGGAIFTENSGDLLLADSVISSNRSFYSGGGAAVKTYGSLTIEGMTFDTNTAAHRNGGGLYAANELDSATISNSTFSNNLSVGVGGGAFFNNASAVTINNTTVTGNDAQSSGAFRFAAGSTATLNQDTITGNTALYAGGLTIGGTQMARISGSIVSGNSSNYPLSNDITGTGGSLVELTHSLIGAVEVQFITATDLGGNVFSTTPGVLALADNGGPTRTMALDPTSAAIDSGPSPVAVFAGNEFDQRGTPWLRTYNGTVDMGAFESQPEPVPTTTTTTQSPTTTSSTTFVPTTTSSVVDQPMIPEFTG